MLRLSSAAQDGALPSTPRHASCQLSVIIIITLALLQVSVDAVQCTQRDFSAPDDAVRYIRVAQADGRTDYLMIAELRAYDADGQEVLVERRNSLDISISSGRRDWIPRMFDGNDVTIMHTDDLDSWMEIDLGTPVVLSRLKLKNAPSYTQRLSGFQLSALSSSREILGNVNLGSTQQFQVLTIANHVQRRLRAFAHVPGCPTVNRSEAAAVCKRAAGQLGDIHTGTEMITLERLTRNVVRRMHTAGVFIDGEWRWGRADRLVPITAHGGRSCRPDAFCDWPAPCYRPVPPALRDVVVVNASTTSVNDTTPEAYLMLNTLSGFFAAVDPTEFDTAGDSQEPVGFVCAKAPPTAADEQAHATAADHFVRYIRIGQQSKEVLNFAELRVFDQDGRNVAPSVPNRHTRTWQLGSGYGPYQKQNAVDGSVSSEIHTTGEGMPFFEVDLIEDINVSSVVVVNGATSRQRLRNMRLVLMTRTREILFVRQLSSAAEIRFDITLADRATQRQMTNGGQFRLFHPGACAMDADGGERVCDVNGGGMTLAAIGDPATQESLRIAGAHVAPSAMLAGRYVGGFSPDDQWAWGWVQSPSPVTISSMDVSGGMLLRNGSLQCEPGAFCKLPRCTGLDGNRWSNQSGILHNTHTGDWAAFDRRVEAADRMVVCQLSMDFHRHAGMRVGKGQELLVRYVRLGRATRARAITREIEAFTADGTNVALFRHSSYSSLGDGSVWRLTDGTLSTNDFYTKTALNQWIEVDLEGHFDIRTVRLRTEPSSPYSRDIVGSYVSLLNFDRRVVYSHRIALDNKTYTIDVPATSTADVDAADRYALFIPECGNVDIDAAAKWCARRVLEPAVIASSEDLRLASSVVQQRVPDALIGAVEDVATGDFTWRYTEFPGVPALTNGSCTPGAPCPWLPCSNRNVARQAAQPRALVLDGVSLQFVARHDAAAFLCQTAPSRVDPPAEILGGVRYIRTSRIMSGFTFGDVQAWTDVNGTGTNVARGGIVRQSSGHFYTPQHAVDGNPETFVQTSGRNGKDDSYIEVDLRANVPGLRRLVLLNRRDGYKNNMQGMYISLLNDRREVLFSKGPLAVKAEHVWTFPPHGPRLGSGANMSVYPYYVSIIPPPECAVPATFDWASAQSRCAELGGHFAAAATLDDRSAIAAVTRGLAIAFALSGHTSTMTWTVANSSSGTTTTTSGMCGADECPELWASGHPLEGQADATVTISGENGKLMNTDTKNFVCRIVGPPAPPQMRKTRDFFGIGTRTATPSRVKTSTESQSVAEQRVRTRTQTSIISAAVAETVAPTLVVPPTTSPNASTENPQPTKPEPLHNRTLSRTLPLQARISKTETTGDGSPMTRSASVGEQDSALAAALSNGKRPAESVFGDRAVRVVATTGIAATAVAGVLSPTAANRAIATWRLLDTADCAFNAEDEEIADPPWHQYVLPVRLLGGSSSTSELYARAAGATLSTVAVLCIAAASCFVVAATCDPARQRPRKYVGVLFSVMLSFYGPSVAALGTTMALNEAPGATSSQRFVDSAIGAGCVAAVVALLVASVAIIANLAPDAAERVRRYLGRYNDASDAIAHGPMPDERKKILVAVAWCLAPLVESGRRADTNLYRLHAAEDIAVATVIGITAGIRPEDYGGCRYIALTQIALTVFHVSFVSATRPYREPVEQWTAVAIAGLQALLATVVAGITFSPGMEVFVTAAAWLALVINGLFYVQVVALTIVEVRHIRRLQRQGDTAAQATTGTGMHRADGTPTPASDQHLPNNGEPSMAAPLLTVPMRAGDDPHVHPQAAAEGDVALLVPPVHDDKHKPVIMNPLRR